MTFNNWLIVCFGSAGVLARAFKILGVPFLVFILMNSIWVFVHGLSFNIIIVSFARYIVGIIASMYNFSHLDGHATILSFVFGSFEFWVYM